MAEITFVGAAGTVTGSKHLVETQGRRFFVDCGLFQGAADVRALNDARLPIAPAGVESVVVTHGHVDHVGYLPKLVKDGFRGAIHCTPATAALIDIVLEDAANLQQHLYQRGFHHERPHAPPPFYDESDVRRTLSLIQTEPLETPFEVCGARVTYKNAGHILGSAFAEIDIEGKRVVFSGDVGRYDRPLLYDPSPIGAADAIVCESTYGDRVHPPDSLGAFRTALLDAARRRGPIVIPAFAVERTQDILYSIGRLQRSEPAIAAIPVYLDSPMAAKVDALFRTFPEAHKPLADVAADGTFGCRNLTVAVTTEESKALNALGGTHIVVSASGMAAGGRVLHHLHNHLSDIRATIVFVGYQGVGTLGFALVHGAHVIKIYGDSLPVRAAIVHLAGYSAHADENDLRRWLSTCSAKPHLYAVHGEPESAASLATLARESLGWPAEVARRGTTVEI
ncbi:MAG: MBL fold metallo-hydrolase RNA specificity domain-containing protein [Vulcanimicrobiaceae bacterium]